MCAGLPTAAFVTWHMARGAFRPNINSRFQRAFGDYPGPFVVKPVSGRASLHVHVVQHVSDLPDVVDEVYRATQNLVLIEQFLVVWNARHALDYEGHGGRVQLFISVLTSSSSGKNVRSRAARRKPTPDEPPVPRL